jgi:hypothetical protein
MMSDVIPNTSSQIERLSVRNSNRIQEVPAIITGGSWAFRGESIWSLLQKLAALNSFSAQELFSCFGSADKVNRKIHSVAERDLRISFGFNTKKLSSAVRLSETDLEWSFYNRYTLDKLDHGAGVFRYCHECISHGIHATLHQVPAFVECPWHNERLRSVCPSCGRTLVYELNNTEFKTPYGCSCGYMFWPQFDRDLWTTQPRQMQTDIIDSYVEWIQPIQTARNQKDAQYIVLHDNDGREMVLDELLFQLNRIYPGPDWLNRTLSGDLSYRDQQARVLISNYNEKVRNSQLDSRMGQMIVIDAMLEQPIDAYFNNNVLEIARTTLEKFNRKLQQIYLDQHLDCQNGVMFINGQFYSFSRDGAVCVWAAAYAMWKLYTAHFYSRSLIDIPTQPGQGISEDHLSLYLKWQYLLRAFTLDQSEHIEKDLLDVLVVVYLHWLRKQLHQEYLRCVDLVVDITAPYNPQLFDGEHLASLLSTRDHFFVRPLSIAALHQHPPAITITTAYEFSGRAAVRLARKCCTLEWKDWREVKGHFKSQHSIRKMPLNAGA